MPVARIALPLAALKPLKCFTKFLINLCRAYSIAACGIETLPIRKQNCLQLEVARIALPLAALKLAIRTRKMEFPIVARIALPLAALKRRMPGLFEIEIFSRAYSIAACGIETSYQIHHHKPHL